MLLIKIGAGSTLRCTGHLTFSLDQWAVFVEGSRAECRGVLAGGETVFINSVLLTYEPLPEAHSDYLCTQVRGGVIALI